MKGFEPLTPSLPWKCSTPELHRPMEYISSGDNRKKTERKTRLELATLSLEG